VIRFACEQAADFNARKFGKGSLVERILMTERIIV
jgi:hypothetical protein